MDIVVENLSKSFGVQKAVDSVSFSVKKGEILGLLGPNGAGKTTIMKIITCFLFPEQGNVTIGKYSIRKHAYKVRQLIGYLPEHNPLYDEMNVIDFLTFIANIHNVPSYKITSRVLDMLRMCGLEHEKHKNIQELSKGYKQRVGLAQALIHDPEVVILDEPTTGLDPNQIADIRELIKNTGKEKTIILSSHILAEIEATCDRVLILNKGKIVADGTAAELRKSNKEKILKLCVRGGETNDIFNALAVIDGVECVDILDKGCFEVKSWQEDNIEKAIFETCSHNHWYLKELIPVERRLEDIFRQVTQN